MKFSNLYSAVKFRFSTKSSYYSNVFKSNHNKRVAISYLTRPFISSVSAKHSNSQEAIKIGEIFDSAGYVVDAIDANAPISKLSGLSENYDLVFGIEPIFLYLAKKYPKARKIYYATGAYCGFQNQTEEKRIKEASERRGVSLSRKRVVAEHNSSNIADGIILIGNDWTKSTYRGQAKKIENIHVSAFSFFPYNKIRNKKDWTKARRSFLWFGSVGAVHKGLDLLLEIFPKHPELELYVCGAVEKEGDFVKIYHKELFETDNIHYIGWTDPNSKKFEDVICKCGFTILPSCSEGMSSSVATCMHAGLIPIVSRESGIDAIGTGWIFKNNTIAEIEKTLIAVSDKPLGEVKKLSQNSSEFAKENFTLEKFEEDFRRALKQLL